MQPAQCYIVGFALADGFDEAPEGCLPSMYKLYGAVKKAYPNLRTMATFSGFSHVPTDLPVDGESCSSRYVSFQSLKAATFTAQSGSISTSGITTRSKAVRTRPRASPRGVPPERSTGGVSDDSHVM